MDRGYLKGLFEATCKEFDKIVSEKHADAIQVRIGSCTYHFVDRVIERIGNKTGVSAAEEIVVAAIRYIDKRYNFFSTFQCDSDFGVKYKGYTIRYKSRVHILSDGRVYEVEITPVTVF